MTYPIVLRVDTPILHPAPAKVGDFVLVWPDRVEIVRPAGNNQGGWLSQWMQGNLTPASDADAERLSQLVKTPPPEPPPQTMRRRGRGRLAG